MNNPEDTYGRNGYQDPRINRPVYGQHAQLVTRWSNAQLEPIVEALAPLPTGERNQEDEVCHCGRCTIDLSGYTETGGGVHYPRGRIAIAFQTLPRR